MIYRATTLAVYVITLVGCSGHIVNRPDLPLACYPSADLSDSQRKALADSNEKVCSGVIYHRLVEVTDTYWYDRILDKDGKIVRHAGGLGQERCVAVQMEEKKLAPSNSPSLISYDPGLLETSKFSVGLTPVGTLASVGTDSTPMGKAAADALASVVTSIKMLTVDANILSDGSSLCPYCNAGRLPFEPQKAPVIRGGLETSGGRAAPESTTH